MKSFGWSCAIVVALACDAGCADQPGKSPPQSTRPPATSSTEPAKAAARAESQKEKDALNGFSERAVGRTTEEYVKVKPRLLEALGPGTVGSALMLQQGVTFSAIPVQKLVQEDAPGAVQEAGLEALSRGSDVRRIAPITSNNRVLSSLTLRWSRADDTLRADDVDPERKSLFVEQINHARDVHSKKTGTPLNAYKGVSFFGLKKHFLYLEKDGRQEMIPIERDPNYNFVPGEAQPAEEVIKKLKEMAIKRAGADAPS